MQGRRDRINRYAYLRADLLGHSRGHRVKVVDVNLEHEWATVSFGTHGRHNVRLSDLNIVEQRALRERDAAGRMCSVLSDFRTDEQPHITLTSTDRLQIRRLSTDYTQYIIDIPFGRFAGRQNIRIPFRHIENLEPFPIRAGGPNSWLNHRFRFDMDYQSRDEQNNVIHSFSAGNTCCIRDVVDNGKILMVVTHDKDNGKTRLRVDYWAGTKGQILNADLDNHTFQAIEDFTCKRVTTQVMRRNDIGFVRVLTNVTIPGGDIVICNVSQNRTNMQVEMGSVQVGYPLGTYTVKHVTPVSVPNPQPPLNVQGAGSDVLSRTVLGILTSVWNARDLLPSSIRRFDRFFNTDNNRNQTLNSFLAGLWRPTGIANCLSVRPFTLENLQRNVGDVSTSTRAGVYLRTYQDFPTNSPFHGNIYLYVGKTVNFRQRHNAHLSSARTGPSFNSFHYTVARAARTSRVLGMFSHTGDFSTSAEGQNFRSVIELLITLFVGAMSERTLNAQLVSRDPQAGITGNTISSLNLFNHSQVANTWTGLFDEIRRRTGFPELTSTVGRIVGLNVRVPMYDDYDHLGRPRWTCQDLQDRRVFTREPVTFASTYWDGISMTLNFFAHAYGQRSDATVNVQPDPAHGLEVGTQFWAMWEVMTNGAPHPAPHFRVPDIGSFSNWNEAINVANMVGLKVIWQHNDQWYAKYVQRNNSGGHLVEFLSSDQGSLNTYAVGAGLYGYFMRGNWDIANSPRAGFYRDFGQIEVLQMRTEHYRQELILTMDAGPIRSLGRVTFNVELAANHMRHIGLHNVAGAWRVFQRVPNDPAQQKVKNHGKFVGNRTQCDYCFILHLASTSPSPWSKHYRHNC